MIGNCMYRLFYPVIFLPLFTWQVRSQPASMAPECIIQKAMTIAAGHRINQCEGSDRLLYIDRYLYHDTALYRLVFENKSPCPDYINHAVYYDSLGNARIQVSDGGIKYQHKVIPAYINMDELKFAEHIRVKMPSPGKNKTP